MMTGVNVWTDDFHNTQNEKNLCRDAYYYILKEVLVD